MSGWRKFTDLLKTAPKSDILVMVLTFILTVVFDLVVAIEVGIVLTAVLFMKRMSDETNIRGWISVDENTDKDSIELREVPENVRVYEVNGPLFFGAADKLLDIEPKDFKGFIILRMRSVTALDVTAMNSLEELYDKCEKAGITLILSHVNEQPLRAMKKQGLYKRVGAENFCPHIDKALERTKML